MTSSKHVVVASSSSASPDPAGYRQVVAEATVDGANNLCALHPRTMKNLSISDGDVVLLKSKRRREARCVAVADDECPERKLKINEAVRSDLRVHLSNVVFVYACPDGALRTKPSKENRMLKCSLFVSLIIALCSVLVF